MAKKENNKNPNPGPPPQAVQLPQQCPAEGCNKKPRRAGFCKEHFTWFKEGLITREGFRAKDFDKKYQEYLRREEEHDAA